MPIDVTKQPTFETMSKPATADKLFQAVRTIIEESRNAVYRAANTAMAHAYWNIGRLIVEEEQSGKERAEYGAELIDHLSGRLKSEYGKGFTATNLKYMRQFYNTFPKSHALSGELS